MNTVSFKHENASQRQGKTVYNVRMITFIEKHFMQFSTSNYACGKSAKLYSFFTKCLGTIKRKKL